MVMELATGGDLQSILDEDCVPYEAHVAGVMRQVLRALVAMHGRSLVHLDVKPQNIVLMGEFPECEVKLCDFEISKHLTPGYEICELLGTPDYIAPEILRLQPISTKSDMWSFGVMVYSLLSGFSPFTGNNDHETFFNICNEAIDFPQELFEDVSADAIDFMSKLLVQIPEERMSAEDCLNHSWIKNLGSFEANNSCDSRRTSIESTISEEPELTDTEVADVIINSHTKPPVPPVRTASLKDIVSEDDKPVHKNIKSLALPASRLTKGSRMGSRQDLNKLRTISKSREVLSERAQMLNIKKNLSKSRGRLYDPKLSLSASKEDLLAHKDLYQSYEALHALSKLHENGALYQSCNNIFATKFKPRLSAAIVNNERMFSSMASIDKLSRTVVANNHCYSNVVKSEEMNQVDKITRRNTDINLLLDSDSAKNWPTHVCGETRIGGLRANPCRGGRTAGGEEEEVGNREKEQQSASKSSNCKTSKYDRLKRDAQHKKRLDSHNKENERHRKYSLGQYERVTTEDKTSPTSRRGSVCHVERRLQERQERLLGKQEKQTDTGKPSRRLSSSDTDHTKTSPCNTLTPPRNKSRSITPNRRRSYIYSSSDSSQASSMESVICSTEAAKQKNSEAKTVTRRRSCTARKSSSQSAIVNKSDAEIERQRRLSKLKKSRPKSLGCDLDEAYGSLGEDSTTANVVKEPVETMPKLNILLAPPLKVNDDAKHKEIDVMVHMNQTEIPDECEKSSSEKHSDTFANLVEDQKKSCEEDAKKCRSKSVCTVQKLNLCVVSPRLKNRSNSMEQNHDQRNAEWKELCNGSVAKALRSFAVPEESQA